MFKISYKNYKIKIKILEKYQKNLCKSQAEKLDGNTLNTYVEKATILSLIFEVNVKSKVIPL